MIILTFNLLRDRQNDQKVLILEKLLANHLSPVQTVAEVYSKSTISGLNGGWCVEQIIDPLSKRITMQILFLSRSPSTSISKREHA